MRVIDTLSTGFGTINRRPWVIAVPVLLDLFLWLGPRLTAEPVFARALEVYRGLAPGDASTEQLTQIVQQVKGANIFAVLAWQLGPLVATASPDGGLWGKAVLSIQSDALLLGIVLVLGVLGLVATCLYLEAVAQVVREESFDLATYFRRLWVNFRRLAGYFLLLIGLLALFGIPLAVVMGIIRLISPAISDLLLFMGLVLGMWLFLYLFFVNHAIFVGGRPAVRAIGESVHLVSRNFWSALWLILLVNVILVGTSLIWAQLLVHPIGVLAAILGNAYIASGLVAGAMVFYRERVQAGNRVAGSTSRVD